MSKKISQGFVSLILVLTVTFAGVTPAFAAAPTNDSFFSPTTISGLPFSDAVNNSQATLEIDEPSGCFFSPQTVWYSFTASTNTVVEVNTTGSSFSDTTVNVYQASGPGITNLSLITCGYASDNIGFGVVAGTNYYIQTGSEYSGGGDLHLNMKDLKPVNDNFANAMTVISPLPFDDLTNLTYSSAQTGEPTPTCAYYGSSSNTVWYAYTPTTTGSVSASLITPSGVVIAAYKGNSLTGLTEVGCQNSYYPLTIHVNAGTLYYFQVGNLYPWDIAGSGYFHVEVTPSPSANFYYNPSDASVFDNISFCDYSSDPVNIGFQFFTWNFGDTATSTDSCALHKYSVDGNYTVQHSVTTFDGRTASTSQVVQVRTHDVAISKFSVPQTARVNQTKTINVELLNKRYSDYVQVTLIKGLPGGGEQVIGTLTLYVPEKAKQATTFKFSYTFSPDDATIGKVTFKAVATIVNNRDAFLSDNTSIITTTVSR